MTDNFSFIQTKVSPNLIGASKVVILAEHILVIGNNGFAYFTEQVPVHHFFKTISEMAGKLSHTVQDA